MSSISPNLLIHGDNIKALKMLVQQGITGIKLAYLDPPYCTNTTNEHYCDCCGHTEFMSYLTDLIRNMLPLLADDGTIALQIDSVHSFDLKHLMDLILGKMNFRGQIVIGKNDHKRYKLQWIERIISGYDCMLLYTKTPKKMLPALVEEKNVEQEGDWTSFYTTSPQPENRYCIFGKNIMAGSWRKSKIWADKAINNYHNLEKFIKDNNLSCNDLEHCIRQYRDFYNFPNKDLCFLRYKNHSVEYYLPPTNERHLSDNWSDINIRGNETDFEHEVSVPFLVRLFNWLTQKNDIILDPFLGSGTSIIAASMLNRKWIGIEKEEYCKTATLARIRQFTKDGSLYEVE